MRSIERFRESIMAGDICIGVSITFSDPMVTSAISEYFDFVWLELEHCIMNPETVMGHILSGFNKNLPTFIRVPGSSTHIIKPFLDSGASGIIVPQVKSAEEVLKIVNDCRYPPIGERGYGPRIPSNFDRVNVKEYFEWMNSNIFVAVMIENKNALDCFDEILKVPGLDSIVIGAADLSGSLGYPGEIEHPCVQNAIDIIIGKARDAGIIVGAGIKPEIDKAKLMIEKGVQWIQMGNDYHYLIEYARKMVFEVKGHDR